MKEGIHHSIENTSGSVFSVSYYEQGDSESLEGILHFHKNYELVIVTEGSCSLTLSGKEYELLSGDCAIIKPFKIHSVRPSEGARVCSVCFHEHLIYTLALSLDGRKPKSPVFRPSDTVLGFFSTELCSLFPSSGYNRSLSASTMLTVKACLYSMGGELIGSAALEDEDKNTDNLIADVISYIASNFKNDISLKDIAKANGYSYYYLSRTFNKILKMNFKSLLNQYRAEYAVALIEDTKKPFSYIAFESGFQNLHSFNEYCRLIFGKTPREIRSSAKVR